MGMLVLTGIRPGRAVEDAPLYGAEEEGAGDPIHWAWCAITASIRLCGRTGVR